MPSLWLRSWEHKSRGCVRKSNTPPTAPDLRGYKRVVGAPTLNQQDQHPHHKETVGSALLSHNPPVAVPSAQKGLTSRFGKDTGCNPLAKTTNTTKQATPPKKGRNPPVSETIYPLNNPTHKPQKGFEAVLAVNRTVDANTIKHTNQNQSMQQELLLVIGQLVLVSWSPYNVYTPSLSTR